MTSDPQPLHTSELQLGQIFAERYKILELLGRGGVSDVYKTDDLKSNSIVALKIIRPAATKSASLTQYKREMNVMRRISQSTLVRIIDLGEYLGHAYISMEFVDGVTLKDYLKEHQKVSLNEFFNFFDQLCTALTHFHSQGVIHRDIHPANIMIGKGGSLKLMDFGVGREMGQDPTGTPGNGLEYAAPEQFAGGPFTSATDVYSVGAVCYEMLAGHRLHTEPQKGGPRSTKPPFSSAELPGVPAGLVAVIDRCLQTDPAKRFQEAGTLRSAGLSARESVTTESGAIPLQSLMQEIPPSPSELIPLFLGLIRRVREIHAAGLFHRQLSPKNIRFAAGSVELETCPPPAAHATVVISEPKYTAPELFVSQKTLDIPGHISSDIYVIGFIFYELLAGRKEMERQIAEFPELRTDLGWMRWHSDPSRKLRPVASIAPSCPKPLADILERMIEKEPSKRPRTFEEVEDSLSLVRARLERTQVIVIKKPPVPAAPKKRKRNGLSTVLAAGAFLVMMGLGGWLFAGGWSKVTSQVSSWLGRVRPSGTAGAAVSGSNPSSIHGGASIIDTPAGAMLLIPEGDFLMGNDSVPDEAPAHTISLPAFYIDRVELSNRYFREFCLKTHRSLPAPPPWDANYFQKNDYPIVNVTREDARDFCSATGKRLPTEAEWEKAARGTENGSIVWGNWRMPGLANLKDGASGRPMPTGSFPADISPFGVLDMAGNVQEWVAGSYQPYGGGSNVQPAVYAGPGVVRGGSFAVLPAQLSPAWRASLASDAGPQQLSSVGFRCAADAAFERKASEPTASLP